MRDEPWFVTAFDRLYLHIYPHRDDAEAEAHAPAICRLLHLRAGSRVLDIGCGAGRHARALARRGVRVTGVDLSEDLLEVAHERSPNLPGAPTYLRWDIRHLPFFAQFEGAISMFTSFGYFGDAEDDLAIMRGVGRSLVPGGRFLVDYLNAPAVRGGLEPVSDVTRDGLLIRMERHLEEDAPGGPCVVKRVRAVQARTGLEEASFEERVRLYTLDDIDRLLADAGLEAEGEPLGDFDGTPYGPDTPRLLRVGRRPGARR